MQYNMVIFNMSSSDRKKPEQIPGKENIEETKAMFSKQAGVEGERKVVDVKDYCSFFILRCSRSACCLAASSVMNSLAQNLQVKVPSTTLSLLLLLSLSPAADMYAARYCGSYTILKRKCTQQMPSSVCRMQGILSL